MRTRLQVTSPTSPAPRRRRVAGSGVFLVETFEILITPESKQGLTLPRQPPAAAVACTTFPLKGSGRQLLLGSFGFGPHVVWGDCRCASSAYPTWTMSWVGPTASTNSRVSSGGLVLLSGTGTPKTLVVSV